MFLSKKVFTIYSEILWWKRQQPKCPQVGSIQKRLPFVVTLLVLSSIVAIMPALAQVGVTTPSVPSFGVMYEPHTYYVSPTYGVDPSTGKAVITHEGYYEEYKEVWVSISNQPFEPYNDSKGNHIELFYDVRWKAQSTNAWEGLPGNIRFTQTTDFYLTGIVFGFRGYNGSDGYMALLDYVPGTQIDFQVKASIGYYTKDNVFVGQTSGWSNTQTLTIPDSSATTTSPSNPTPSVPEFTPAIALGATLAATALLLAVVKSKRSTGQLLKI